MSDRNGKQQRIRALMVATEFCEVEAFLVRQFRLHEKGNSAR